MSLYQLFLQVLSYMAGYFADFKKRIEPAIEIVVGVLAAIKNALLSFAAGCVASAKLVGYIIYFIAMFSYEHFCKFANQFLTQISNVLLLGCMYARYGFVKFQEWVCFVANSLRDLIVYAYRYSCGKLKELRCYLCRLLCCSYKEDFVILSAGNRQIEISCGEEIESVWISLSDFEGVPVCHGQIDKVGVELGTTYFILHADIYSNVRTIRWKAKLK